MYIYGSVYEETDLDFCSIAVDYRTEKGGRGDRNASITPYRRRYRFPEGGRGSYPVGYPEHSPFPRIQTLQRRSRMRRPERDLAPLSRGARQLKSPY